jgi:putative MATE family efflux protein
MSMNNKRTFFKFVIPSIIAFAFSGIYAIVDGFFVGNTIGDAGLSAINIAYPIVAILQAIGTGLGMGGAVYYSINKAEGHQKRAGEFIAYAWWLLIIASIIVTIIVYLFANPILKILGAENAILSYGTEYIKIIALGAVLQILGTGLVPFMRNYGGSFWAMFAMMGGFITNIILDYLFVWVYGLGMTGAATATIIGQGVTMFVAIAYALYKKCFFWRISFTHAKGICKSIFKVGLAPFGLALTPNISLILINRFSASYGGEKAITTYACISYIICIIYLILQGVGDGSQPLMSRYYGEKRTENLISIQKLAYRFAIFLAIVGCIALFAGRNHIGILFGTSAKVNTNIAKIIPIFLVSIPFVAITRIATASFYATEKNILSYVLTFIEPLLMLTFMLILPPLFGGQIMIWWSTVFARIFSALLALALTKRQNHQPTI